MEKLHTNNTIERASRVTIEDCLQIREEDRLVIIADQSTYWIAEQLWSVAKRKTDNISMHLLDIDMYGKRPLKSLPDEIRRDMEQATASIYTAVGLSEELSSVRYPILNIVKTHKIRHVHMHGIRYEEMKYILTTPNEINEFGERLHKELKDSKKIHITTGEGTDLTAERGSNFRWENSYGVITPGIWENLPSGEVFTCPVRVNGKIIVDGSIGQGFDRKYGILRKTPLTLRIEDSRVVSGSVDCKNEELKHEFVNYIFNTDYGSSKVGEIGIGTNPGIKNLTGSLLVDEKCMGTAHIAFGNPPQQEKVGKAWWESDAHIDCVMQRVNLYVDDKQIIKEGKWLI